MEVMKLLIYTVRPGDTLYEIAKRYRIPVSLLESVNGIEDPSYLSVGQALFIAKPTTEHTVSQGETLYSIARKYKTTLSSLWQKNPHLKGQNEIKIGDTLVIRYEGEKEKPIAVNGYAYPFIEKETLDRTLPYLSYLSPFSYGFTSSGDLTLLSDDCLIREAKNYGVNPIMVLSSLNSDGRFDNSLTHQLLCDTSLQDILISNLISNMILKGFRTLLIDFQFLFPEDSASYVEFLAKLKKAMIPYHYELLVSLAPKTESTRSGLLFEGQDQKGIGEVADKIALMSYEWGYRFGHMRSVSPYPEIVRMLDYAQKSIPSDKIMLGIANYAYDITHPYHRDTTNVTQITNTRALQLARERKAEILFDNEAKSPYFRYFSDGNEHTVIFQDARSIQAIMSLVEEKKLCGIGIWNIMQYTPQLYFLLSSYQIQ